MTSLSSPDYANAIIAYLFPNPTQLVFIWARDRCTMHFNYELSTFYWRKNLNKVKRSFKRPLEQIVMIDDSPEKLERHYGNLIAVTPFEGNSHDTELRDLIPYLAWLQSIENIRAIEKRSWRTFSLPKKS